MQDFKELKWNCHNRDKFDFLIINYKLEETLNKAESIVGEYLAD